MSAKDWGIFAGVIAIGLTLGYGGSLLLRNDKSVTPRQPSFQITSDPTDGNPSRSSSSDYQSARSSSDYQSARGSIQGGKRKSRKLKKTRRK
jgi:hypothetical protein